MCPRGFRRRPPCCLAGVRRIRWGFACFRCGRDWRAPGVLMGLLVAPASRASVPRGGGILWGLGDDVRSAPGGGRGPLLVPVPVSGAGPAWMAVGVRGPGAIEDGQPVAPTGRLFLRVAEAGRAGVHRSARRWGPVSDCRVGFTGFWLRWSAPPVCGVVGGRGPSPTCTLLDSGGVVGGRGPGPTYTWLAMCGVVGGRGPGPTYTWLGIGGVVGGRGPDPTNEVLCVAALCAWGWYPV